jgi:2-amino-4-hydroxy-6-hydroxymethyldihydropteridine diphosphokinase
MDKEDSAPEVIAYLGLGANLGDREANIRSALKNLDHLPTIQIRSISSLYETAPVGMTDQPDFLNTAAEIGTTLTPDELLAAILTVEKELGRVRTVRWGPRVIDIDILAYGDVRCVTPHLTLPHPRLMERAFALAPLAEIAPDLLLPGQRMTVKKKAEQLLQNANILTVRSVIKVH